MQVEGATNAADVLQTDIPACGPSLLQITDAVLIPPNSAFNMTNYAAVLTTVSPALSTAG